MKRTFTRGSTTPKHFEVTKTSGGSTVVVRRPPTETYQPGQTYFFTPHITIQDPDSGTPREYTGTTQEYTVGTNPETQQPGYYYKGQYYATEGSVKQVIQNELIAEQNRKIAERNAIIGATTRPTTVTFQTPSQPPIPTLPEEPKKTQTIQQKVSTKLEGFSETSSEAAGWYYEQSEKYPKGSIQQQGLKAGAFVLGFNVANIKSVLIAVHPVETGINLLQFGYDVAKNPWGTTYKVGSKLYEEYTLNPAKFAGEVAGTYVSGAGLGIMLKESAITITKYTYPKYRPDIQEILNPISTQEWVSPKEFTLARETYEPSSFFHVTTGSRASMFGFKGEQGTTLGEMKVISPPKGSVGMDRRFYNEFFLYEAQGEPLAGYGYTAMNRGAKTYSIIETVGQASKYSPELQSRIQRATWGTMTKAEQEQLRLDLVEYTQKHPGEIFPGTRTSSLGTNLGEREFVTAYQTSGGMTPWGKAPLTPSEGTTLYLNEKFPLFPQLGYDPYLRELKIVSTTKTIPKGEVIMTSLEEGKTFAKGTPPVYSAYKSQYFGKFNPVMDFVDTTRLMAKQSASDFMSIARGVTRPREIEGLLPRTRTPVTAPSKRITSLTESRTPTFEQPRQTPMPRSFINPITRPGRTSEITIRTPPTSWWIPRTPPHRTTTQRTGTTPRPTEYFPKITTTGIPRPGTIGFKTPNFGEYKRPREKAEGRRGKALQIRLPYYKYTPNLIGFEAPPITKTPKGSRIFSGGEVRPLTVGVSKGYNRMLEGFGITGKRKGKKKAKGLFDFGGFGL